MLSLFWPEFVKQTQHFLLLAFVPSPRAASVGFLTAARRLWQMTPECDVVSHAPRPCLWGDDINRQQRWYHVDVVVAGPITGTSHRGLLQDCWPLREGGVIFNTFGNNVTDWSWWKPKFSFGDRSWWFKTSHHAEFLTLMEEKSLQSSF